MGGDYQRDLYKQLMEVMAKLDRLESEQKQNRKGIKRLTGEVASLSKENESLREEISCLKQENAALKESCEKLAKENTLLRNDKERMKRILNNDSSNSSTPPSKDEKTKPANTYNSRKPACWKQGGQTGHKGRGLAKSDVEEKIRKGIYEHRIEEIGTPRGTYVTRYRLDLDVKTLATEIRIYADEAGKFHILPELKGDVSYGEGIKAIKDLDTLSSFRILKEYTGIFTHDHETALYHFGLGHGECNVHLGRYLRKNAEETTNIWSRNMEMWLFWHSCG